MRYRASLSLIAAVILAIASSTAVADDRCRPPGPLRIRQGTQFFDPDGFGPAGPGYFVWDRLELIGYDPLSGLFLYAYDGQLNPFYAYENLAPGSYVLEVVGENENGQSNSVSLQFQIVQWARGDATPACGSSTPPVARLGFDSVGPSIGALLRGLEAAHFLSAALLAGFLRRLAMTSRSWLRLAHTWHSFRRRREATRYWLPPSCSLRQRPRTDDQPVPGESLARAASLGVSYGHVLA